MFCVYEGEIMRDLMILCIDGMDAILASKCKLEFLRSIGEIQKVRTLGDTPETVSLVCSHKAIEMPVLKNFDIDNKFLLWNRIFCKWGIGNIPTVPALKIFGWSIAGYFRPEGELAYPPYVNGYLDSINYEVDIPVMMGEYVNSHIHYDRIVPKRTKAFNFLLREYPVDIAFLWYRCLDGINHEYCIGKRDINSIYDWYERLDQEISKLDLDFKEILIFSDHGVPSYSGIFKEIEDQPHRKDGIFLNNKDYKIEHLKEVYPLVLKIAEKYNLYSSNDIKDIEEKERITNKLRKLGILE